jgi:hypothetical protein
MGAFFVGFPGRGFLQIRKLLPGKTSREGDFSRFKKVFPGRLGQAAGSTLKQVDNLF